MGYTFVEKALGRAAGLDQAVAGQIVDAQPDVALSHDNTAAIARIFRGTGVDRVLHPERLAITLDHAVPAPTTQHAANHAEVRQFVANQGITHFFEAGRGICHQVLSEEAIILPGQTILGADSHTTHFGWMGAFGAGVGRSEMAAIWATGQLWLRVPETIRIDLTGELPPWVTAKDLGLHILKMLGQDAAIYQAIEFGGPGLRTLSIESRMVLPNLMAEVGAKSAYVTPDPDVFHWLAAHLSRRTGQSLASCHNAIAGGALYPDVDAHYSACFVLDLSDLEPLVARPHSPDNVAPVSGVAGTRIQQAFLGTCTNGRLEDLAAAAAIFRDQSGAVRHVAPGTRMLVIPASSQVLQEALAAGYIQTFVAAGAMIGTPGCGPCMGNHMGIPAPGETTISSGNRNFRGRMGTAESDVYLASPAVVAASAVLGRIADPREVTGSGLKVEGGKSQVTGFALRGSSPKGGRLRPEDFDCAQSNAQPEGWQVAGSKSQGEGAASRQLQHTSRITHYESPKTPTPSSVLRPLSSVLSRTGRTWKYGDNVNTDVIFPGKYTYTLREPAEWAQHALEDLDPTFAANVRPGDIIVGGRNWGCGSSREQAVGCLKAAGVQAIVATSFARIYFRNAVNNGLLPVVCPEAVAVIQPGETIAIDLDNFVVHCAAGAFAFPPLSPSLRAIVAAGGLIPMLKDR